MNCSVASCSVQGQSYAVMQNAMFDYVNAVSDEMLVRGWEIDGQFFDLAVITNEAINIAYRTVLGRIHQGLERDH